MTSKVFLFNTGVWLYCSEVTFKDGVYHGYVVNGAWEMTADTTKDTLSHAHGTHNAKLTWVCNPNEMSRDYNGVIANAKARYEDGEPANFSLKEPVPNKEDYEDEVPF